MRRAPLRMLKDIKDAETAFLSALVATRAGLAISSSIMMDDTLAWRTVQLLRSPFQRRTASQKAPVTSVRSPASTQASSRASAVTRGRPMAERRGESVAAHVSDADLPATRASPLRRRVRPRAGRTCERGVSFAPKAGADAAEATATAAKTTTATKRADAILDAVNDKKCHARNTHNQGEIDQSERDSETHAEICSDMLLSI